MAGVEMPFAMCQARELRQRLRLACGGGARESVFARRAREDGRCPVERVMDASGDHFKHGALIVGFKDDLRDQAALGLEMFFVAQGATGFDLSAQRTDELGIFPRLEDEIADAAPHRFDGQLDAAPCGHDDDGQRVVKRPHGVQQVKPFLA